MQPTVCEEDVGLQYPCFLMIPMNFINIAINGDSPIGLLQLQVA